MIKEKPRWSLARLKRMYFDIYCWKCKKFELSMKEYKRRCEESIQKIIDNLEVKEMKFKDFNNIVKNSEFCRFEKRDFSNNCLICKKFGGLRRI